MRGTTVMSLAAALVIAGYVVGDVADVDLGSSAVLARVVVLAAAAVVAVIAFQTFSHASTPHTVSAMVCGLLGGACVASSVTTATGGHLHGSAPMALVGTVAVVAAVTITHVGRSGPDRARPDERSR